MDASWTFSSSASLSKSRQLAEPVAEYLTFASSIAARVSPAKAGISPRDRCLQISRTFLMHATAFGQTQYRSPPATLLPHKALLPHIALLPHRADEPHRADDPHMALLPHKALLPQRADEPHRADDPHNADVALVNSLDPHTAELPH